MNVLHYFFNNSFSLLFVCNQCTFTPLHIHALEDTHIETKPRLLCYESKNKTPEGGRRSVSLRNCHFASINEFVSAFDC